MRANFNMFILLLAVVVMLPSCVSKKKWTELMTNKTTVDQLLDDERKKSKMLEGQLADLNAAKDDLQSKYDSEAERAAKLAGEVDKFKMDLETSQATAADAMEKLKLSAGEMSALKAKVGSAISGGGFALSPRSGRLYVGMEPILFNSGSTRVKRQYNPTLESVANILKGNPSLRLIVEGHADNVPVKAGVAYADNWDVSLARAKSTVQKLIKLGVSATQLLPTGRGDHVPYIADDSAEARKANRRVDFIVMPDVSSLMTVSKP